MASCPQAEAFSQRGSLRASFYHAFGSTGTIMCLCKTAIKIQAVLACFRPFYFAKASTANRFDLHLRCRLFLDVCCFALAHSSQYLWLLILALPHGHGSSLVIGGQFRLANASNSAKELNCTGPFGTMVCWLVVTIYLVLLCVWTNALIAALICSGSSGQTATI